MTRRREASAGRSRRRDSERLTAHSSQLTAPRKLLALGVLGGLLAALFLGILLWRSLQPQTASSVDSFEIADPQERALTAAARAHPSDAGTHIALGEYLLTRRRPYAAIWAFQDAHEQDPTHPAFRAALARALLAAHLPLQALEFLAKAGPRPSTKHQPPTTNHALEQRRVAAAAYLAMGDPIGAIGVLNAAGQALSTSAPGLLDFGNAHEALGDDVTAEAAYRRHLELAPESTEGSLSLARVLARRGRQREALAALDRARRLTPDDPRPIYVAAIAMLARGSTNDGVQMLRRLAAASPEFGPARFQLGVWLLRRGRAAEALPHLEAARDLGAGGGDARLRIAEALEATGRKAAARYQRGVHALEAQDPHAALREFREMARLEPEEPEAAVMIATAYARMNRRDQAAAMAEAGRKRHPDDFQLLAMRAKMLAMIDERDAATALCRRWAERFPNAAEPLFLLASIEREGLRYPEAERLAEQAITKEPNRAEYRIEAARIDWAIGDPPHLRRAVATLGRAIALEPENSAAHSLLADVRRKLGDLDAARRAYERSLHLDPTNRAAALGLAELCRRLGKGERARFYSDIVRALQRRTDTADPLWRRVWRNARDGETHARLAQLFLEAGDLRQARFALQRALRLRPADRTLAQQLAIVERMLALREG
jgi:tetratricopeptide (TPR) repeat protein